MSAVTRVVVADVGTSTVKVGEFLVQKDGVLTLSRFHIAELGLDPNKEEERAPVIARVVRQAMAEAGIKPSPLSYLSLPAQSVFMRFVKLPPVDAMQVEQMIGFEAQQNVPFPIEEVVWDYQLMPGRGGSGETEAIIVAVKADVLEADAKAVEQAGLAPRFVDVAPLALYNAYRYNYGVSDDCVLVIDFGARTTNLLFIEKNHLYTRGIPIAGNLISQNICNEFQEPFIAAETLKKGKGFVSLGGAYADPDDVEAARISKLVRSTMTRLHNEINRSISFYRTQQGGSAPKKVLLTGGSSLLPYADVFIAEKLNLPVEYFNPIRNVNVAPSANPAHLSSLSAFMGEVVGLAVRQLSSCPIEIRLTPLSIKHRQARQQRQPALYSALAAWIGLFACIYIYNAKQVSTAGAALDSLNSTINNLQTLQTKVLGLAKENDVLTSKYDRSRRLLEQRDAWVGILSELNDKIPSKIWITQLTPTNKGQALDAEASPDNGVGGTENQKPEVNQLLIKGLFESGTNPEEINRFVSELAKSPWFDIDPNKISEAIISTDSPRPGAPDLAWNFQLSIRLKKPIDLQP